MADIADQDTRSTVKTALSRSIPPVNSFDALELLKKEMWEMDIDSDAPNAEADVERMFGQFLAKSAWHQ